MSTSSTSASSTKKSKHALPNILITGTPGTGKTSLAQQVVKTVNKNLLAKAEVQYEHVPVSQMAIEKKFVEDYDEQFQSYNLNEDEILDYIEDELEIDTRGGFVVEYHGSEWFPERWFDLVVCLQTDIKTLGKRLETRQYTESKVKGNLECEIYQICLEEAKNSYSADIIITLPSNSVDDMTNNCKTISEFIEKWITSNK